MSDRIKPTWSAARRFIAALTGEQDGFAARGAI